MDQKPVPYSLLCCAGSHWAHVLSASPAALSPSQPRANLHLCLPERADALRIVVAVECRKESAQAAISRV
jgi:hypothetical protein